ITALTLHADFEHLFSNIIIGGLIISFLRYQIGNGWCWFLTLLTGIAGNYFNALVYQSHHFSIGASTAVYGTLGILTGLQFINKVKRKSLQAWFTILGAFVF